MQIDLEEQILKEKADAGDKDCQYKIAQDSQQYGYPTDYSEMYAKMSADQGHHEAQFMLAEIYAFEIEGGFIHFKCMQGEKYVVRAAMGGLLKAKEYLANGYQPCSGSYIVNTKKDLAEFWTRMVKEHIDNK